MDLKQEASLLKNSKLLASILAEREVDIIAAWRSASTVEQREQCATDIKALESLRETIIARTEDVLRAK